MSKFRYPIFPDRTYTIIYEDFEYEVTGEEIIAIFRRGAYLEDLIQSLDTEGHWWDIAPDMRDSSE